MTAYILSGSTHDFHFHDLRQHLPRVAPCLYRFDDAEAKFGLANDHTLTTTDKAPVTKMMMYVDIDDHEPNKGARVNFDPSWPMKVANSVKYGKKLFFLQKNKRVDDSEPGAPRKAYLNLTLEPFFKG